MRSRSRSRSRSGSELSRHTVDGRHNLIGREVMEHVTAVVQ